MDLYYQSDVFAFHHTVYVYHSFSSKKQSYSSFIVAVIIQSDFRAQEEEIFHRFHLFPFYFSWSDETGCHDLSFLFVCLF